MTMANIIIGADICSTENNVDLFSKGEIDELIGSELKGIISSADVRIFNLEGPLLNDGTPIEKCGPNVKMDETSIKGIKALNPTLLTIANNHIMDYGPEGLTNTISILHQNEIEYVGCGMSINEIIKYRILNIHGIKLGILACAEHEFSIATEFSPGANPYDPLSTFDEIEELKEKVDFLIVLYHGGKELYRYPTPNLQRVFRKMADKGANLVVAQHTHCIGCMEEYRGSTLIYGQGNFIFDKYSNEYWNSGFLISVEINDTLSINYIPFIKEKGRIRYDENTNALNDFFERSTQIKEKHFVQEEYKRFATYNMQKYMAMVHGDNILLKGIRRLSPVTYASIVKNLYKRSNGRLRLLNCIECESHIEMLSQIVKLMK